MFKNKFYSWLNSYYFYPSFFQILISLVLLPLSEIYCLIVVLKRLFSKKNPQNLPIISIGNLIIGGTGKTPVTLALAKYYKKTGIILRGYKRKSKGLKIISLWGNIQANLEESGDEAMLYAKMLPNSLIIVCEDRQKAIDEAISQGAKIVFLDDGFSKAHIDKFDILIRPKKDPKNPFCLPGGPYRESKFLYKKANLILKEDKNFKRLSYISNKTKNMVLVTAIANPIRLEKYFSKTKAQFFFPDHYNFKKEEIETIINQTEASSILVTRKDFVKLESFNFPVSIIELEIELNNEIYSAIDNYILSNFNTNLRK